MNDDHLINVVLPDKQLLPVHFNIFEVGVIQKNFINSLGVGSESVVAVLRLSVGNDESYRLKTDKLLALLLLAEKEYSLGKLRIEFEYNSLYYVLHDIYRFNHPSVISFQLKVAS
jgi:hypothetical protein